MDITIPPDHRIIESSAFVRQFVVVVLGVGTVEEVGMGQICSDSLHY